MDKIVKSKYQGYVWYSDCKFPEVVDGEYELELSLPQIPFIVEGLLFDQINNISISIKHIDGTYLVKKYEVSKDDYHNPEIEKIEYMSHRIPGVDKLLFLQYWHPVKDELCCGMEALMPSRRVFIGFK